MAEEELVSIEKKKVRKHMIEYDFTYYYIIEYISKILHKYTVNGHTGLNAPSGEPIPYAQLTKDQVVTWVKSLVGDNMQELADSELAALKSRKATVLSSGTPWA